MQSSAIIASRPLRAFRLGRFVPLTYRSQIVQRRTQSRAAHAADGEAYQSQTVRLKKPPFFSPRRVYSFALYAGAVYGFLLVVQHQLDVTLEFADLEEEEDNEEHGQDLAGRQPGTGIELQDDDFYADKDSLFVPMTWATKMPREFYKGSDPEWQEFIKVAKDPDRQARLMAELAAFLQKGAQSHPLIMRQLGGEVTVGKYWLDTQFPEAPPQDYTRAGLEFGDGFIAWSMQRINQEDHLRHLRALWPEAVFDSLWTTVKALAGVNYRRAQQALGLASRDPLAPEERWKTALDIVNRHRDRQQGKGVGNAQLEPGGPANPSDMARSEAKPSDPVSGSRLGSSDAKTPMWPLPSIPLPSRDSFDTPDLPMAMHIFQSTLNKRWNPQAEPPRGAFIISGLVEMRGKRGRMLFEVSSCYQPKQDKFITVNAGVKSFKRWNQHPKGGN